MSGKVSLDGIALVTGAASGIGKETGFAFAEAGCRGVVFADVDEEAATFAAEESKQYARHPSYRSVAVRVDVTDEKSIDDMVGTTVKEFGRIDYSVNSAGVSNAGGANILEQDIEPFERVLKINATGTTLCVRAVSRVMAKQEPLTYKGRHSERSIGRGAIVNVGSVNSVVATSRLLNYVTSKFAVMGITKTAALDNIANQIRVNAVLPGWCDTPMLEGPLNRNSKLSEWIHSVVPGGRIATPEEIADYIVFVCSPGASYINGTGMLIDNGLTLTVNRASL
ncbi:MAG: hypothetical protein M1821_009788 [Bathelium mastoideum]|nr:MAG: hypothetical protein M1821_009788 [Bathelium mastoideum]